MRAIDVAAAVLLVIGGLNWGLIGVYDVDLVTTALGGFGGAVRSFYAVVGAAAVYQAVSVENIRRRWSVSWKGA